MRTKKFDRLRFASAINKVAADDTLDAVGITGACAVLLAAGGYWIYKQCTDALRKNRCAKALEDILKQRGFGRSKTYHRLMWWMQSKCMGTTPDGMDMAKEFQEILDALIKAGCDVASIMAALKAVKIATSLSEKDKKELEKLIQDAIDAANTAASAAALAALVAWLMRTALNAQQFCSELCVDSVWLYKYIKDRFPSISGEAAQQIAYLIGAIIVVAAAVIAAPELAVILAGLKADLAALLVALGLAAGAAEADGLVEDLVNGAGEANKCGEDTEIVGPPAPTEIPNETDGPPPSGYFDGGDGVNTGVD